MRMPRALCNHVVVAFHAWQAIYKTKGGVVLECGAYEGVTSATLHYILQHAEHPVEYIAADTFTGFAEKGKEQSLYKEGDLAPSDREKTISKLERIGVKCLIGRVEDTLQQLDGRKISFVFLDMDIEAPTRFAWNFLRDKIAIGGRIGFHDYKLDEGYSLPGIARVAKPILSDKKYREVRRRKDNKPDNRYIFFERVA